MTHNIKFILQRVEKNVGKGENACYQGRLNLELFGRGLKNGLLRAKNCLRNPESLNDRVPDHARSCVNRV